MYGILSEDVKSARGVRFNRVLIFVLLVSSTGFFFLFISNGENHHELIWDRLALMVLQLFVLSISFGKLSTRQWYYTLSKCMYYLSTAHALVVALVNQLNPEYLFALVTNLIVIGISFRKILEASVFMAAFFILFISSILVFPVISDFSLQPLIWISCCSAIFMYFLIKLKCDFQDQHGAFVSLLKSVLSRTQNGIVITDTSGRILDLNSRMLEMNGHNKESLINKNIWKECVNEEQGEFTMSTLHELKQKNFLLYSSELKVHNADPMYVDVSMVYLKKADHEYIVHRITDCTEHKNYEKQLLVAKEEAEKSARMKSEFLAEMSHEIRTPLNGVIGLTSLLESTGVNSQQKEIIETIKKSGRDLMVVINDILDFSKIESGKMKLDITRADFREAILEVADLLRQNAESKGLQLKVELDAEIPQWVWTDMTRVKQVLLNLLGNAIKFTSSGYVKLSCSVQSILYENVVLRVCVSDSGSGFSESSKKQLFQSFSQLNPSVVGNVKGTGLGLVISKQLVELLGGEIDCSSDPGRGSEFFFTIPCHTAESQHKPNHESGTDAIVELNDLDLSGLSFMIAEDNKMNQQVLLYMLKSFGIEVDVAKDGFEAVELYNQKSHDIILMDIQMPGLNGIQATKHILNKAQLSGQITEIIAITANATASDQAMCRDCGMSDFLPKPFLQDQVASILVAALKRIGAAKKLTKNVGGGLKRA